MSTIYTINNKIATINGKWMTKYGPPKLRIDLICSVGYQTVIIDSVRGLIGGSFEVETLTPTKVTGYAGSGNVVDLTDSTWQKPWQQYAIGPGAGAYISFEFEPFTTVPTSSDLVLLESTYSNWMYCTVKVYYNDELINTLNDVEWGYQIGRASCRERV